MSRLYCILVIIYHCVQLSTNMTSQNKWVQHKLVLFFYVHGTVHPYNIVLVSNQWDAAFVLLGLLSLYMFRARFASIFRSNKQNCNGSHQCVSMHVRWRSPISSGICKCNNNPCPLLTQWPTHTDTLQSKLDRPPNIKLRKPHTTVQQQHSDTQERTNMV